MAARVIPLVIDEGKLNEAKKVLDGEKTYHRSRPFTPKKAAIITTGSEVYYHRIEDKFGPV